MSDMQTTKDVERPNLNEQTQREETIWERAISAPRFGEMQVEVASIIARRREIDGDAN